MNAPSRSVDVRDPRSAAEVTNVVAVALVSASGAVPAVRAAVCASAGVRHALVATPTVRWALPART